MIIFKKTSGKDKFASYYTVYVNGNVRFSFLTELEMRMLLDNLLSDNSVIK